MPSSLMEVVGLVAGALTASMAVPQAVRVLRHRAVTGVAPTTYGGFAGVGLIWAFYGLEAHRWAVLVANTFLFATSASVLVGLAIERVAVVRAEIVVALVAALAVVLYFGIGPVAVGWWAACLTALIRLPQVRASGGQSVIGVSIHAWAMVTGANVLWVVYGVSFRDPRVATGATLGAVLGGVILVRTVRRRMSHRLLPSL